MKKSLLFGGAALGIVICVLSTGCGTTVKYNVQSTPVGALVTIHTKQGDLEDWSEIKGVTPIETKVFFYKEEPKFMTAEKRGYEPCTMTLTTKDSETNLSLPLKRIEGVSEDIFDVERLRTAKFKLFPAAVDVYIHSGVGNLDKIEKNQELSGKITNEFYEGLMKLFDQNKAVRVFENGLSNGDWEDLSKKISEYLFKLDEKRLPYLSRPPLLAEGVPEFKSFQCETSMGEGEDSEIPFYIYLYGKCVSETTGRKVGNVLLNILGAATQGASMGMVQAGIQGPIYRHHPEAFMSDSGTMIMLYFIDGRTSEVLHIEGRYFAEDLIKADQLVKVAQKVAAMIRREEKR